MNHAYNTIAFWICIITFASVLYFPRFSPYFLSVWRSSFSISYRTCLTETCSQFMFVLSISNRQLCWVQYSWVTVFSFSIGKISCSWPVGLLLRNLLSGKQEYYLFSECYLFSLSALLISSLSFTFESLVVRYLGIDLVKRNLTGDLWPSCIRY